MIYYESYGYAAFLEEELKRYSPETLAELVLCGIDIDKKWPSFGPISCFPHEKQRIFQEINIKFRKTEAFKKIWGDWGDYEEERNKSKRVVKLEALPPSTPLSIRRESGTT